MCSQGKEDKACVDGPLARSLYPGSGSKALETVGMLIPGARKQSTFLFQLYCYQRT